MKIRITQSELNECVTNAVKRIMSEGKSNRKNGFEKASKSANRDIEREYRGDGFKSYDKVHKNPKDYSRKGKDKFVWNGDLDEAKIDFTHPDDPYSDDGYDTTSIPDIEDISGFTEIEGEDEKKEPTITIKTDIDEKAEQELIDSILEEYPDAEYDVVEDCPSFNIPKRIKKSFVKFLLDSDVNLVK